MVCTVERVWSGEGVGDELTIIHIILKTGTRTHTTHRDTQMTTDISLRN